MKHWNWEDMTVEQRAMVAKEITKIPVKHKYGAKPRHENGKFFASQGEFYRWKELQLLEKAGAITGLKWQPVFKLTAASIKYRADYEYIHDGQRIVKDFKGKKTPRFNMICKLWRYYGPCMLRITGHKGKSYGHITEEIIPEKNTKKRKKSLDI